ncbi:MAG TPA: lipid II flippase MurJ, partial [Phycisphaerales bacterium]|nr:lipid II flippase MurJ [Phycisphaerales bacterium]
FDPDETPVVAAALAAFSIGLSFNGMQLMLNRAFFSLQSPWTPTWIALVNLALNVALYAALYPVGAWGIPLAISLSNIAATAILLAVLRPRLGSVDFRAVGLALARVALASAALAGAAYVVWAGLDGALGRSLGAQLVSVGGALAAGAAVYLVCCRLLGVREIEPLLTLPGRVRRR